MKVFKFYIGSKVGKVADNTDFAGKVFSKETIISVIENVRKLYNDNPSASDIDGYTLYTVNGMWKGIPEDSYVLEIMADNLHVDLWATQLKKYLLQDSIMVSVSEPAISFF